MPRFTLRSIELRDFCSFQEQRLQFDEPGVVVVQGFNHDSGSASGCGKSRLLLALAYAAGVAGNAAKPHVRWGTERTEVRLELGGDKAVVVTRGTAGLRLDEAGESRSGREAAARLREVFGLPPSALESLVYRRQRRRGFFLGMGASGQQDFLRQVLGLVQYDELRSRIAKKIEGAGSGRAMHERRAEVLREAVARQRAYVESLPSDSPSGELEQVRDAIRLLQDGLRSLDVEIASRSGSELPSAKEFAETEAALAEAERSYEQRRAELSLLQSEVGVALANLSKQEADLMIVFREGVRADEDLGALMMRQCPTCHQPWHSPDHERHLRGLVQAGREAHAARKIVKGEQDLLRSALAEAGDIAPPNMLRHAVQRLRAKLVEERSVAQKGLAAQRTALQEDLFVLQKEEVELVARISRAALRQQSQAALDAEECTLRLVEGSLASFSARETEWRDLDEVVANWLVEVLGEVLAEIAARANEFLAAIPNVQHVSLVLRTARQLQDGREKTGVSVAVFLRGEERSVDDLSGGQESALELATDVAVAEVVSARTGCFPGWMVLDEPFEGMTEVERSAARELLARFAERMGAVVFVVDHSAELQSAMDRSIVVEMRNGVSTARYCEQGKE